MGAKKKGGKKGKGKKGKKEEVKQEETGMHRSWILYHVRMSLMLECFRQHCAFRYRHTHPYVQQYLNSRSFSLTSPAQLYLGG